MLRIAGGRVFAPLLRSALCGHMSDDDYANAQRQALAHAEDEREFPGVQWRGQTMTHRRWLQLDEARARLRQRDRWRCGRCKSSLTCSAKPSPLPPRRLLLRSSRKGLRRCLFSGNLS